MDTVAHESAAVCHVLEEDRDLAEAIPPRLRAEAFDGCRTETLTVAPGRWEGTVEEWPEGWLALLVLRGLLLRRVGVAGRFGAELLGTGDLLRPSRREENGRRPILALSTSFQVIEPARMAVLDERFAASLVRYPQLSSRLVERALRRSRHLAVNMAIVHQARVDVRLNMLLWHLAGRWGRVGNGAVSLPLRLTHDVLADLTAARRPTVSSALTLLAREGHVRAEKSGWLLLGDPPAELLELGEERRSIAGAAMFPPAPVASGQAERTPAPRMKELGTRGRPPIL